jgi:spermidine synthase
MLTLDGYFQFDSETERWYHSFLVTLPGLIAGDLRWALIMGGGDGLALRDAITLGVGRTWLIELDKDVLAVSSKPPVSDLNGGSLADPRAVVITGDARGYIDSFPDGFFDLIIADFPAATSPELEKLYEPEFYDRILRKLSPVGVFASQVSEQADFLRQVRLYLERALGHSFALVAIPRRTETEGFVYASRLPLEIRRPTPAGAPISSLVARIEAALREGKKVLTYHAPMRPIRTGGSL